MKIDLTLLEIKRLRARSAVRVAELELALQVDNTNQDTMQALSEWRLLLEKFKSAEKQQQ